MSSLCSLSSKSYDLEVEGIEKSVSKRGTPHIMLNG